MAEAFLRSYASDRFEVHSAGLEPKGFILPEVVEVMKERGLDMAGQTSKGVKEYLGKTVFAHTITVCGDAEENCPAIFLNMGKHEHWPSTTPPNSKAVTQNGSTSRAVCATRSHPVFKNGWEPKTIDLYQRFHFSGTEMGFCYNKI
jgi:protein-tyrosine-phosphatase